MGIIIIKIIKVIIIISTTLRTIIMKITIERKDTGSSDLKR